MKITTHLTRRECFEPRERERQRERERERETEREMKKGDDLQLGAISERERWGHTILFQ